MAGDPKPPEPRSTIDVLNLLRSTLLPDGPFEQGLLHSFKEAQSNLLLARSKTGESLPIRHQQIFAYDTDSKANTKLMQELFYQKVEIIRLERPVILLDVQELAKEKVKTGDQGGITHDDLIYSLSQSLASCVNLKKEEESYPVIKPHYVPEKEKHLTKKIHIPNDLTDAELAFIWGETNPIGPEFKSFDSLMLLLSDGNFQRRTNVLIPETIVNAENRYGSPWVGKLSGAQLEELDSEKISQTVAKTRKALDSADTNKIRVIIRPFGTGKTRMLKELEGKLSQEGIPEAAFIDGTQSIDEQKYAFEGNVIFVDEAVNLDLSQLIQQIKNGSIVILFYPTREAVKQKMPESLWPDNSYTIIE